MVCVTENCFTVQLKDVARSKSKTSEMLQHHGHSEWVRQGKWQMSTVCRSFILLLLQQKTHLSPRDYVSRLDWKLSKCYCSWTI